MFLVSFCILGQQSYWQKSQVQKGVPYVKFGIENQKEVGLMVLNEDSFKKALATVSKNKGQLIYFPNKEGKLVEFEVFETPVFPNQLGQNYPQIRSFTGISSDKKAKVRFSISHRGLQAMCIPFDATHTLFIQKVDRSKNDYLVYQRDDRSKEDKNFVCRTMGFSPEKIGGLQPTLVDDQTLRRYRIAVWW